MSSSFLDKKKKNEKELLLVAVQQIKKINLQRYENPNEEEEKRLFLLKKGEYK